MRNAALLGLLCVLGACSAEVPKDDFECVASSASTPVGKPRKWPPIRGAYVNPILAENELPGDPDWRGSGLDGTPHVELYADHVSAKAGDTVQVMVRSDQVRTIRWRIYRVGWYAGAGARL